MLLFSRVIFYLGPISHLRLPSHSPPGVPGRGTQCWPMGSYQALPQSAAFCPWGLPRGGTPGLRGFPSRAERAAGQRQRGRLGRVPRRRGQPPPGAGSRVGRTPDRGQGRRRLPNKQQPLPLPWRPSPTLRRCLGDGAPPLPPWLTPPPASPASSGGERREGESDDVAGPLLQKPHTDVNRSVCFQRSAVSRATSGGRPGPSNRAGIGQEGWEAGPARRRPIPVPVPAAGLGRACMPARSRRCPGAAWACAASASGAGCGGPTGYPGERLTPLGGRRSCGPLLPPTLGGKG